jgi:hypothetical protein
VLQFAMSVSCPYLSSRSSSIQNRRNCISFFENTSVSYVRSEVFTVVTMKNGVFWDVTPCGSCKN